MNFHSNPMTKATSPYLVKPAARPCPERKQHEPFPRREFYRSKTKTWAELENNGRLRIVGFTGKAKCVMMQAKHSAKIL